MRKMRKFFFTTHRILGSILSLVFLVWFLSGFVMIYSGFPHANRKQHFETSEPLSLYKNQIVWTANHTHAPQYLSLEVINKRPVFMKNNSVFHAQTGQHIQQFKTVTLDSMVQARYHSSIHHKKILNDYDAWIPWDKYKAYFPIHKYYLNDNNSTQVYVASTTGKVVQESTSTQRWLARFGAIPHWWYFKSLRLNQGLWASIIIWVSGIGAIMSLVGLIVGIYASRKWRKIKKKGLASTSPYKKPWYRWHHIVGLTFGVFVFTFVLSGMFSLADVPQWLMPIDKSVNYKALWEEETNNFEAFTLPVSTVLTDKRFANTKKIEFRTIDNIPYYLLYQDYKKPIFVAANQDADSSIQVKTFTYQNLANLAAKKFEGHAYSITELTAPDNYYNPKKKTAAKLVFDDNNRTWLYINTLNPSHFRSIDKSQRVIRWVYQALHTFNFPKIGEIEWLRKTILIILLIFGTIVSLSGTVLGYRFLRRKIRKWRR